MLTNVIVILTLIIYFGGILFAVIYLICERRKRNLRDKTYQDLHIDILLRLEHRLQMIDKSLYEFTNDKSKSKSKR